jgi:hypothetical protein
MGLPSFGAPVQLGVLGVVVRRRGAYLGRYGHTVSGRRRLLIGVCPPDRHGRSCLLAARFGHLVCWCNS